MLNESRIREIIDNEWLELGDTTQIEVAGPFAHRSQAESEQPLMHLLGVMRNPRYFAFTIKHLLNIQIHPFQLAILDELWNRPFPMFIATRGGGKSWLLALYCVLRSIFCQGSKIVVVGAAFRQAKVIYEYSETIWNNAPILRSFAADGSRSGPRRDIDRCTLRIGDSITTALPLGDGCLSPDTLTTYVDSFASMGEEHTGEEKQIIPRLRKVWSSFSKDFVLSDEAYSNGMADTKVVTTHLGLKVEGTPNHRLRVLQGLHVVWKRLDELSPGDRLLVDRSWRWHSAPEQTTEDEAYALGLMIGDGCWTNPYSLGYATGLQRWGLKTCGANDKVLPPVLLRSSREAMSACLSGLFDTDGHVRTGGANGGIAVGFTNTSETLVRQMQYILLHYGIISSLRSRKRSEKWARCYELLISGQNVRLFVQYIGFRLKRKRQRLKRAIAAAADGVPHVQAEMTRVAKANRIRRGKVDHSTDSVRPSEIASKKCITREFVDIFIRKYAHTQDAFLTSLDELANPDVYYDRVVSVEDGHSATYDIHVPGTHEYCAGGFFTHNTKIRGARANITVADEYASIPNEVFENVVGGFTSTSMAPIEHIQQNARKRAMKRLGIITEDESAEQVPGLQSNQTILAGTAYYGFNHFYAYWKKWKAIIESRGDKRKLEEIFAGDIPPKFNWKHYSIIRLPVELLPEGFMDEVHISKARATIHTSNFLCEYAAVFPLDSNGFFKRSLVESCVVGKPGKPIVLPSCGTVNFSAVLRGDPTRRYVMAIDPASESDNFSILILEVWPDHCRVVFCWTTTRKRHKAKLNKGLIDEHDYYGFAARKIRDLLGLFPCDRLAMDSQGGGIAVMEALGDPKRLRPGERPILPVIHPEKDQPTDNLPGDHILELISFSSAEWVSEANHGLRSDMEGKALLFPEFDSALIGLAAEEDKIMGRVDGEERVYDTLEDTFLEIEELKDELSTIVHTQTGVTKRDHWDTPEVKLAGGKKGRLRKDRYSALLMANMVARQMARVLKRPECPYLGGFAHLLVQDQSDKPNHRPGHWNNPAWYTEKGRPEAYTVVRKN